jgi:hypothetical protein
VSAVVFAISLYVVIRWFETNRLSDLTVYQAYARDVRSGAVPYRDFPFEYPPAALPALALPAYMGWSFATSFAVLMGALGGACIAAAASALQAAGAGVQRSWVVLLAIGVSPLVLGSLVVTHFDLWPTLLAVGGLVAIIRERPVASGVLLGLGLAAKLWPAVLLPIGVVYLWRRRGRRAGLFALGSFVAAAAACFLPFVIMAPHGVRAMFADQLNRPLQVESLGAAVLMAAQRFGLRPLATINSHGAQALSGRGAGLAADLQTVFEVATVVAIWIIFARRRHPNAEAVLLAAGAAVAALVAFDRVLSPQYLIWIIPFALLVGGERGLVVGGLLFLALGLTQAWQVTDHYWALAVHHVAPYSWYLLARDLILVLIAALLLFELSRARDSEAETERWPDAQQAGA